VASGNSNYKAEGGKLLSKDGKTLVGYPSATGELTLSGITSAGDLAFVGCSDLETVSLPAAASIGSFAFANCTSLATVNLSAATSIGENAFYSTGAQALTVTLPQAAPSLATTGYDSYSSFTKPVTVKTPSDRSGYDSGWEADFTKAFGVSHDDYTVTINLTIEYLP
jgi:hypothetical protein